MFQETRLSEREAFDRRAVSMGHGSVYENGAFRRSDGAEITPRYRHLCYASEEDGKAKMRAIVQASGPGLPASSFQADPDLCVIVVVPEYGPC